MIITAVASAIAGVILVTVVIAVVIGSGNEDNGLENKEGLTEKQIDSQKNPENLTNDQNTTMGTNDGQSKDTGIFFKVLDGCQKTVPSFRMTKMSNLSIIAPKIISKPDLTFQFTVCLSIYFLSVHLSVRLSVYLSVLVLIISSVSLINLCVVLEAEQHVHSCFY